MKYNLTFLFLFGFVFSFFGSTTVIFLNDSPLNLNPELPKLEFIHIQQGDTVKWVSTQTAFKVDGRYDQYPNNPCQIYSSDAFTYVFEFVFENTGDYGYECFNESGSLFYQGIINVSSKHYLEDRDKSAMELRTNPFDQTLELSCHSKVNEIEVFNEEGNLVTAQLFEPGAEDKKIDLSQIRPGPHLIRMITDSGVYIKRVVKK